MLEPKYPHVIARPADGNAFSILGAVSKAMRRARIPQAEVDEYFKEAASGTYDNLISTSMRWVTLEASDVPDMGDD